MKAFDCAMCGHCCQGSGGIVMGPADQDRLAGHLGRDRETFLALYAESRQGKAHLTTGADGCCVFFVQGAGCSVHVAKPDICRAWPFFRGNLEDESSWRMAQEYCPGINPAMSHAEFVRQGYAAMRAEGLITERTESDPNALRLDPRPENGSDPA
jgi:Fe-S-cluster containining protein